MIRPRLRSYALVLASAFLAAACTEQSLPTAVLDGPSRVASYATTAATELFFSEYVEGSGNNKALEVYNGTGAAIDLAATGYAIQMYFNGSTSAGLTLALIGTVGVGDVYVVANSSAVPEILAEADQTNGAGWFNGDDAVVLTRSGVVVDAIGEIGVDPGSEWGSGDRSTQNNTLRRMMTVCGGDPNTVDPFDPATEWDGYATDTFDGLGSHAPQGCSGPPNPTGPTELFVSEYIEGSSFNKAFEIFNGTGAVVDLAARSYAVEMYFNGNTNAGLTIALTGTVAGGDVYVVAQNTAAAEILAEADQTSAAGWFNGDDAVVLTKNGVVIDAFGQVGFDPGSEWGSGEQSTQNNTLRRMTTVCVGDADPSDVFDPAVEWDGYSEDTFDGLGEHAVTCGGRSESAPEVASTVPMDGDTDIAVDANIDITFSEPVDLAPSAVTISCTTTGVVTAAISGGPTRFTLDPSSNLVGGESCTVTVAAAGVTDQDTDDPPDNLAADFVFGFTTAAIDVCGAPYTAAYAIQGSGATTPLAGQTVTTEGVVVGDYEGVSPALRGFYVQDMSGDGDAATSDGVFVFNGNDDHVTVGDVVRVTGTAEEFFDQTQIGGGATVIVCSTGATVTPVDVTLPVSTSDDLERFEGMLVRFPQTLYVTEHFQLGRFGQVLMSTQDRLYQPTHVAAPGGSAAAVQAANDLNRIIVDDADTEQNPDPIDFGLNGNPLSAGNTLRGGDAATGIVGILSYGWAGNAASGNAYRLRTVGALGGGVPSFQPANPRAASPPSVGGTLKVAGFNVLNYYNTFSGCTAGAGGVPVSCRGADDDAEFQRQYQKIVSAIVDLDADVLGLIELENDGYGSQSAIADLVDRVNTVAGAGTYAFIDADGGTGQVNALGVDAIKVGMIYQPASVAPVGRTAALNSVAFVNGGDGEIRNRPALAQAFEDRNGGVFIAAVNHFKSKGQACDAPDAGDGQGNCNDVRTAAAQELAQWLATDPTGTRDPDALILGDLNAYAMEDPIEALKAAGYTDLLAAYGGPQAYSFVFDGQWGYLDYALASSGIASQVTGVAPWHVNADEPAVLDYNTNFKSPGQQVSLYARDAFRSSDHDPVIVGLGLTPELDYRFGGFLRPVKAPPAVNTEQGGRSIPVKFSLGDDQGLDVFADGHPLSRRISCSTGQPAGPDQPTRTSGRRGFVYSPSDDIYRYLWRTTQDWSGICRELVVQFKDGTEATALFQFR